jgi:hypothetical protein
LVSLRSTVWGIGEQGGFMFAGSKRWRGCVRWRRRTSAIMMGWCILCVHQG